MTHTTKHTAFNRKWTDEQIGRIRFLYEKKTPLKEIAREFRVEKNAISGVIWRHIKMRKKNQPKPVVIEQKKPRERKVYISKPKPLPFAKRPFIGKHVSLMHVKDGQCRDIIGDPRFFICCGDPVYKGCYCKDHYTTYYKREPAREVPYNPALSL